MPEPEIEKVVAKVMDLSPRGIIEHIKLRRPIHQRTSAYGHFGRSPADDGGFSWEKLDLVDAINKEL
jgi:S-adenosylmethionine synthetase